MTRHEFVSTTDAPDEPLVVQGSWSHATLDVSEINASVLKAITSAGMEQDEPRLRISRIRAIAEALLRAQLAQGGPVEPLAPLQMHRVIREGLPGRSLLGAGSLLYDSVDELTAFFDMTPKTLRERLKQAHLDTNDSELAMRAGRVSLAAAQALGSFDQARQYLRTRNFALGGATPLELIKTAEGERMILDELQAHADDGPL